MIDGLTARSAFEGVELQISRDPCVAKESHTGDRTQFVTPCAVSPPVSDTGLVSRRRAVRLHPRLCQRTCGEGLTPVQARH